MLSFSSIKADGPDALSFLQGQLTQNLQQLTPPNNLEKLNINPEQSCGIAALCNPKGRTISLLWIKKIDNQCFILTLPQSLSDKVTKHLQRFVFRAKIQFIPLSQEDPMHLASLQNLPPFPYIPWIDEQTSEQYIPQMLNLDCLNGISFNKGCYTGQEIIARMHYLGEVKRRTLLIHNPNNLVVNEALFSLNPENGHISEIGKLLLTDKEKALAVVAIHAQNLQDSQGRTVQRLEMPYPIKKPE